MLRRALDVRVVPGHAAWPRDWIQAWRQLCVAHPLHLCIWTICSRRESE